MNFRLKTIAVLLLVSFAFEQLSLAAEIKAQAVDLFGSQKVDLGFKLPESIGTVEDSWRAPGSQKTVILIQDAHTNRSGQLNLSKTLDLLLRKNKDLKYIFAEAAVEDNSLSFLRAASDPAARKQVADSYLRKGLLHGAEYLDLTSDHEFMIWGVEDIALYMKSLESYRAVVKERERFQNYLKRIGQTIRTLEPRIYNPALIAFEETRSKFLSEEISLTDYFEVLTREAEKNSVQLSFYPHLAALKTLKEKEDAIDFKLANEEQLNAVRSLSAADQKELRELSENEKAPFKLSSEAHEERRGFYAYLEEKLEDRLQSHPELAKYFEYLRESKKIDPKEILNEQKAMETEVLSVLAKTRDERMLLDCRKNLEFFKKLFDLTLTPEEYKQYKEASRDLTITRLTGFLNKKIMDLGTYYERAMFLEEGYEEIVRISEEFYELTKDRDEAFLKNMFSKMEKESQKKAVFITGGFHTPSLKNLLKERNISYISITPQVTQETNQKRYEQILLSQKVNPNLLSKPINLSSAKMDVLYSKTAAPTWGVLAELPKLRDVNGARLAEENHSKASQDWLPGADSESLKTKKKKLFNAIVEAGSFAAYARKIGMKRRDLSNRIAKFDSMLMERIRAGIKIPKWFPGKTDQDFTEREQELIKGISKAGSVAAYERENNIPEWSLKNYLRFTNKPLGERVSDTLVPSWFPGLEGQSGTERGELLFQEIVAVGGIREYERQKGLSSISSYLNRYRPELNQRIVKAVSYPRWFPGTGNEDAEKRKEKFLKALWKAGSAQALEKKLKAGDGTIMSYIKRTIKKKDPAFYQLVLSALLPKWIPGDYKMTPKRRSDELFLRLAKTGSVDRLAPLLGTTRSAVYTYLYDHKELRQRYDAVRSITGIQQGLKQKKEYDILFAQESRNVFYEELRSIPVSEWSQEQQHLLKTSYSYDYLLDEDQKMILDDLFLRFMALQNSRRKISANSNESFLELDEVESQNGKWAEVKSTLRHWEDQDFNSIKNFFNASTQKKFTMKTIQNFLASELLVLNSEEAIRHAINHLILQDEIPFLWVHEDLIKRNRDVSGARLSTLREEIMDAAVEEMARSIVRADNDTLLLEPETIANIVKRLKLKNMVVPSARVRSILMGMVSVPQNGKTEADSTMVGRLTPTETQSGRHSMGSDLYIEKLIEEKVIDPPNLVVELGIGKQAKEGQPPAPTLIELNARLLQYNPHLRFVGIDINPMAVNRIKEFMEDEGKAGWGSNYTLYDDEKMNGERISMFKNTEIIQGGFEKPAELYPGQVDLIRMANLSWYYNDHERKEARELLARALRTGGVMLEVLHTVMVAYKKTEDGALVPFELTYRYGDLSGEQTINSLKKDTINNLYKFGLSKRSVDTLVKDAIKIESKFFFATSGADQEAASYFNDQFGYSAKVRIYDSISFSLDSDGAVIKSSSSPRSGARLSGPSKEETLQGLFASLGAILDENLSQFRSENGGLEFPSTRLQQEELFNKVKPLIEEWVSKNLKENELTGIKVLEENLGYPEGDEEYHRNVAAHSDMGIGIYAHIWKAGGKTAIHNHGGILGIPVPLAPGIREIAYRMIDDPGKPYQDKLIRMEVIGNTEMPAYKAAAVTRGPGIHEVHNTSDKPVIVLEIYFGHFNTILNPIPIEGEVDAGGGRYLFTEQNPADLPVPIGRRLADDRLIEVPGKEFLEWLKIAPEDKIRIFTTEGTVIVSREQAEQYLTERNPRISMTRHQIVYMDPVNGARLGEEIKSKVLDAVVVGAGPAGLMAAAALNLLGLSVELLERNVIGDTWRKIPEYLIILVRPADFYRGILTPRDKNASYRRRGSVLKYLKRYIEYFKLEELIQENWTVEQINRLPDHTFEVISRHTQDGYHKISRARNVIFGAGVFHNPNRLNVPGEENFPRRVIKVGNDDNLNRHLNGAKNVVIVGGGNSAMRVLEKASQTAEKITLIIQSPKIFWSDETRLFTDADPKLYRDLVRKLETSGKLKVMTQRRVSEFSERMITLSKPDESEEKIPYDKVFLAIGFSPALDFLISQGVGVESGRVMMNKTLFLAKDPLGELIRGFFFIGIDPLTRGGAVIRMMGDQARVISSMIAAEKILRENESKFEGQKNGARLAERKKPLPRDDVKHALQLLYNVAHSESPNGASAALIALKRLVQDKPIFLAKLLDALQRNDVSRHVYGSFLPADSTEIIRVLEEQLKDQRIRITDPARFAEYSAGKIADEIRRLQAELDRDINIVFATGNTMIGVLEALSREPGIDWSRVQAFHLDEYKNLPAASPYSFAYYLHKNFFDKVPELPAANIHYIGGIDPNLQEYMEDLKVRGGADIVLLGIGLDGHLAFNEPPDYSAFDSRMQEVSLNPSTVRANLKDNPLLAEEKNRYAYSMGMADIFEGRELFLLANGPGKAEIISQAIEGPVTQTVPASKLQDHPNVTYILDTDAAKRLNQGARLAKPLDSSPKTSGSVMMVRGGTKLPDSIRQQAIFSRKRVVILDTPANASIYAGGMIEAIRLNDNEVRYLPADSKDFLESLDRIKPGVVMAMDRDQNLMQLLQEYADQSKIELKVLLYPSLENRSVSDGEISQAINLTYAGDAIEPIQAAIRAHKTQVPRDEFKYRTAYDEATEWLSRSAALTAEFFGVKTGKGDFANNFVVADIDPEGRMNDPDPNVKYQVVFLGEEPLDGFQAVRIVPGMPILMSSPHPDDAEIAAPFLIIGALRNSAEIYNIIHTTGRNAVIGEDPLVQRLMGERSQNLDEIKESIRTEEASDAAKILMDASGRNDGMTVENLKVDLLSDSGEKDRKIKDYFEGLIKKHQAVASDLPFVAVVPHPLDSHPTHRDTADRDIRILKELAAEYQVQITLLFYLAPWAGDYDTYYQFTESREKKSGEGLLSKAMDAYKRGLSYLTVELAGSFGLAPPYKEMRGGSAERFKQISIKPSGSEPARRYTHEEFKKILHENKIRRGDKVKIYFTDRIPSPLLTVVSVRTTGRKKALTVRGLQRNGSTTVVLLSRIVEAEWQPQKSPLRFLDLSTHGKRYVGTGFALDLLSRSVSTEESETILYADSIHSFNSAYRARSSEKVIDSTSMIPIFRDESGVILTLDSEGEIVTLNHLMDMQKTSMGNKSFFMIADSGELILVDARAVGSIDLVQWIVMSVNVLRNSIRNQKSEDPIDFAKSEQIKKNVKTALEKANAAAAQAASVADLFLKSLPAEDRQVIANKGVETIQKESYFSKALHTRWSLGLIMLFFGKGISATIPIFFYSLLNYYFPESWLPIAYLVTSVVIFLNGLLNTFQDYPEVRAYTRRSGNGISMFSSIPEGDFRWAVSGLIADFLVEQGYIKSDDLVMEIFSELEYYRQTGESSEEFKKGLNLFDDYTDPFERVNVIRALASQGNGANGKSLHELFERAFSSKKKKESAKAREFTSLIGKYQAGVVEAITRRTDDPEDAWNYLRMLIDGESLETAEMRILRTIGARLSEYEFKEEGAAEFYEKFPEFSLEKTSTEQSNPITVSMSQVLNDNPVEGLKILIQAEKSVVDGVEKFSEKYLSELLDVIAEKILNGNGRVFFIGSGSSGRAGVEVQSIIRRMLKEKGLERLEEKVIGIIAGGERAAVRAKEGFEDSEKDGREAVRDYGVTKDDIVILISASGSAPFNVGAGEEAHETGAQVYYFYNSGSIPDRTQKLFDGDIAKPILVDTGAQAIRGSTRLQAASLAIAALGMLLEAAIQKRAGPESFDIGVLKKKITADLKSAISKIENHLAPIAQIAVLEKEIFSSPRANFRKPTDETNEGYVTFVASEAIRDVLTDAVETPPTFKINFVRLLADVANRKKRPEYQAYAVGVLDNISAWLAVAGRKILPKYQQETEELVLGGLGDGKKEAFWERPSGPGNMLIGVLRGHEVDDFENSSVRTALEEFKKTGGKTSLIVVTDRELAADSALSKFIKDGVDAGVLIDGVSENPLIQTLTLKMVLNMRSNAAMTLMGKVSGNMMTDLSLSNNKLKARAVRYIKEILENHGVPEEGRHTALVIDTVFNAERLRGEAEDKKIFNTPATVPIVSVMLKHGVSFDRAVQMLVNNDWMLEKAMSGARLAGVSVRESDKLKGFVNETLKEVKDYPLERIIPKKKDQNALLKKIREAMIRFDRKKFIRSRESYLDKPLPIGHNQTISQPSLVALELFALNLQKGERVLEVGGGSGWMAALMSDFVGSEGNIYAVERVPQLVRRTKDRFKRLGIKNIQVIQAGEELGYPKEAPYDVILVSAGAPHIPEILIDQLAENGRMIIPVFDREAQSEEFPYQLTYFQKIKNKEGNYDLVGGTLLPTTAWVDLTGKGAWIEWGPLIVNDTPIQIPEGLDLNQRMSINAFLKVMRYDPDQIDKLEVLLGNGNYVEHGKNSDGHFGRAEWDPSTYKGIRISANSPAGARLAEQTLLPVIQRMIADKEISLVQKDSLLNTLRMFKSMPFSTDTIQYLYKGMSARLWNFAFKTEFQEPMRRALDSVERLISADPQAAVEYLSEMRDSLSGARLSAQPEQSDQLLPEELDKFINLRSERINILRRAAQGTDLAVVMRDYMEDEERSLKLLYQRLWKTAYMLEAPAMEQWSAYWEALMDYSREIQKRFNELPAEKIKKLPKFDGLVFSIPNVFSMLEVVGRSLDANLADRISFEMTGQNVDPRARRLYTAIQVERDKGKLMAKARAFDGMSIHLGQLTLFSDYELDISQSRLLDIVDRILREYPKPSVIFKVTAVRASDNYLEIQIAPVLPPGDSGPEKDPDTSQKAGQEGQKVKAIAKSAAGARLSGIDIRIAPSSFILNRGDSRTFEKFEKGFKNRQIPQISKNYLSDDPSDKGLTAGELYLDGEDRKKVIKNSDKECFEAVEYFLTKNDGDYLAAVLTKVFGRPISKNALAGPVYVLHSKYGNFENIYQVVIKLKNSIEPVILAFHIPRDSYAQGVMAVDTLNLQTLIRDDDRYAPRSYALVRSKSKSDKEILIHINQWILGADEIHLNSKENGNNLILWHYNKGLASHLKLNTKQSAQISRQIFKILSLYNRIDLDTVALNGGDFIAHMNRDGSFDVYLITARMITESPLMHFDKENDRLEVKARIFEHIAKLLAMRAQDYNSSSVPADILQKRVLQGKETVPKTRFADYRTVLEGFTDAIREIYLKSLDADEIDEADEAAVLLAGSLLESFKDRFDRLPVGEKTREYLHSNKKEIFNAIDEYLKNVPQASNGSRLATIVFEKSIEAGSWHIRTTGEFIKGAMSTFDVTAGENIKKDSLETILDWAFENAIFKSYEGFVDLRILQDDSEWVVQMINPFNGSLPEAINNKIFDVSSQTFNIPSEQHVRGGHGYGVKGILTELRRLMRQPIPGRSPSVQWKKSSDTVIFELRIPIVSHPAEQNKKDLRERIERLKNIVERGSAGEIRKLENFDDLSKLEWSERGGVVIPDGRAWLVEWRKQFPFFGNDREWLERQAALTGGFSDEVRFEPFSLKMRELYQALPSWKDEAEDIEFALSEALKNAVVHGNNFKKSLPVWITWEVSDDEAVFKFYDLGLRPIVDDFSPTPDAKIPKKARVLWLAGNGMGVSSTRAKGFDISHKPLTENGQASGVQVTLKKRSKDKSGARLAGKDIKESLEMALPPLADLARKILEDKDFSIFKSTVKSKGVEYSIAYQEKRTVTKGRTSTRFEGSKIIPGEWIEEEQEARWVRYDEASYGLVYSSNYDLDFDEYATRVDLSFELPGESGHMLEVSLQFDKRSGSWGSSRGNSYYKLSAYLPSSSMLERIAYVEADGLTELSHKIPLFIESIKSSPSFLKMKAAYDEKNQKEKIDKDAADYIQSLSDAVIDKEIESIFKQYEKQMTDGNYWSLMEQIDKIYPSTLAKKLLPYYDSNTLGQFVLTLGAKSQLDLVSYRLGDIGKRFYKEKNHLYQKILNEWAKEPGTIMIVTGHQDLDTQFSHQTDAESGWASDSQSRLIGNLVKYLEPNIVNTLQSGKILLRGPGRHVHEVLALREIFPSAEITVADPSWNNLTVIKRELDSTKYDYLDRRKILLMHADFKHIPVPDGYFDAEFSKSVIDKTLDSMLSSYFKKHEIPSWIEESKRILSPKGVYLTTNSDIEFFTSKGFHIQGKDRKWGVFVASLNPDVFLFKQGARLSSMTGEDLKEKIVRVLSEAGDRWMADIQLDYLAVGDVRRVSGTIIHDMDAVRERLRILEDTKKYFLNIEMNKIGSDPLYKFTISKSGVDGREVIGARLSTQGKLQSAILELEKAKDGSVLAVDLRSQVENIKKSLEQIRALYQRADTESFLKSTTYDRMLESDWTREAEALVEFQNLYNLFNASDAEGSQRIDSAIINLNGTALGLMKIIEEMIKKEEFLFDEASMTDLERSATQALNDLLQVEDRFVMDINVSDALQQLIEGLKTVSKHLDRKEYPEANEVFHSLSRLRSGLDGFYGLSMMTSIESDQNLIFARPFKTADIALEEIGFELRRKTGEVVVEPDLIESIFAKPAFLVTVSDLNELLLDPRVKVYPDTDNNGHISDYTIILDGMSYVLEKGPNMAEWEFKLHRFLPDQHSETIIPRRRGQDQVKLNFLGDLEVPSVSAYLMMQHLPEILIELGPAHLERASYIKVGENKRAWKQIPMETDDDLLDAISRLLRETSSRGELSAINGREIKLSLLVRHRSKIPALVVSYPAPGKNSVRKIKILNFIHRPADYFDSYLQYQHTQIGGNEILEVSFDSPGSIRGSIGRHGGSFHIDLNSPVRDIEGRFIALAASLLRSRNLPVKNHGEKHKDGTVEGLLLVDGDSLKNFSGIRYRLTPDNRIDWMTWHNGKSDPGRSVVGAGDLRKNEVLQSALTAYATTLQKPTIKADFPNAKKIFEQLNLGSATNTFFYGYGARLGEKQAVSSPESVVGLKEPNSYFRIPAAKEVGARLTVEEQPGARLPAGQAGSSEPGETNFMDSAANFFFQVRAAHAQEAKEGARLSLEVAPEKSFVFKYSEENGEVYAQAEGNPGLRVKLEDASGQDNKEKIGLQDARQMENLLNDSVERDLDPDGVEVNSGKPAILGVDLDMLPAGDHFEPYIENALAVMEAITRNKPKGSVYFRVAGTNAENVEAFLRMAEGRGISILESGKIIEGASEAALVTKDFAAGLLNIPVQTLEAGDVPALRAILEIAYAATQIDPANLPDGFISAWKTASGRSDLETEILSKILSGRGISKEEAMQFKLKPITKLNLDEIVRYLTQGARMAAQAA